MAQPARKKAAGNPMQEALEKKFHTMFNNQDSDSGSEDWGSSDDDDEDDDDDN